MNPTIQNVIYTLLLSSLIKQGTRLRKTRILLTGSAFCGARLHSGRWTTRPQAAMRRALCRSPVQNGGQATRRNSIKTATLIILNDVTASFVPLQLSNNKVSMKSSSSASSSDKAPLPKETGERNVRNESGGTCLSAGTIAIRGSTIFFSLNGGEEPRILCRRYGTSTTAGLCM